MRSSGVSPKAAQTLARHSDINLTMNVYSHVQMEEQAAAAAALAPPPKLSNGAAKKGRKRRTADSK